MPVPGSRGSCSASQARRSAWSRSWIASSRRLRPRQRPADDLDALAELLDDVGDDAVVRGGRRREDRDRSGSAARSRPMRR